MSRAFGSVRQGRVVITTYGPGALIDPPSQDRLTRTPCGADAHETRGLVV